MKPILREEDMPLTGEFRPSAPSSARSAGRRTRCSTRRSSPRTRSTTTRRSIARLAKRYLERLKQVGALDFDDLLLEAVRLFDEAPDVLARYQDRWRYLHVDEYQDTNRPQYLWIRALAAKHRNLAVVGDDDQSIYGWRGANIRNILDFERDYPDATVVKLEQNYRSTQLILDAAHAVVSRNTERTDKKLWTAQAGGRPIQRFEAYNEEEEAEWIARQIEGLVGGRGSVLTRRADDDEEKLRARDVAVMYRMNAQSRAIEESFLRYGIRYQLVGGTRFYARREVKDALAYLRILRSDTDSVSFERIINVPARAIGDKTIEALRAVARRDEISTWEAIERAARGEVEALAPRARTSLADFAALVRRLRSRVGVLPLPGAPRRRPRGVRLPGDAGRRLRGRRGALGEPARAALGHDPLRRPRAGGRARPAAGGDGARRRPGLVRGRRRRGHAHHAPRRQGPRVPRRVHRRARGGPLPAQPGTRRREGARGGAAARVRRHHPGEAAALPVPRLAALDLGDGPGIGAVAVPARDPGRADGRPGPVRRGPGGRRRRRTRPRPGPRVRLAADDPLRDADPAPAARRSARAAAGQARRRPARRSGRRATSPPSGRRSRPGAPSGIAQARRSRRPFGPQGPARPPRPDHSRRAPVPRRRPGPPRAVGRRDHRELEADPDATRR